MGIGIEVSLIQLALALLRQSMHGKSDAFLRSTFSVEREHRLQVKLSENDVDY
jgi:hypothetical protein